MQKRQMDEDVFTSAEQARSRSIMMGLNGDVHTVTDPMGQAMFMPGASHEDYMDYYNDLAEGEDPMMEDDSEEEEDGPMAAALRVVMQEIMSFEKADGKTLDKPFRLPAGSSKKFGVYVKDGDKVKKVTFGDPNMEIRRDDAEARASFRARHSCDTQKDKTTAAYWSCRMWEKGTSVSEMTKLDIEGKILKTDDEQRLVYGWASVITENGQRVVDRQGDVIEADTLVKAVNDFMEHVRVGKTMHVGEETGRVIHSLPVTKEICDSLGIQSDREGWIVAYKVYDDAVWEMVKSGQLAAFSIGGRAVKEKIDA
jgi:hypothetical protein